MRTLCIQEYEIERCVRRLIKNLACVVMKNVMCEAGSAWRCLSGLDRDGRTIWIVDARRDDGKRFVVGADEKLTAFVELQAAIRGRPRSASAVG